MEEFEKVLKYALDLNVCDRAALAEKLLASLDDLSEEEADRLWAEEAQRRLAEYRSGQASAISADELHEKAERMIR